VPYSERITRLGVIHKACNRRINEDMQYMQYNGYCKSTAEMC
jgi:hypothetical protein